MGQYLRARGEVPRSARTGGFALVATCLFLALGGCTSRGKDFVRPDPNSLLLGQTTIADVIGKQGPPTSRVVRHGLNPAPSRQQADERDPAFRPVSVAGTIETLMYSYSYSAAPGIVVGPMSTRSRHLVLTFWNDRVIYYGFDSSFSQDSTHFDENKALSFVIGQSSQSDVIRELGPPSGEAVYPFIAKQGTRLLIYQNVSTEASGATPVTTESVTRRKVARFLFDSSGKLIDSSRQTSFFGN
jgi:hypothetical protein